MRWRQVPSVLPGEEEDGLTRIRRVAESQVVSGGRG